MFIYAKILWRNSTGNDEKPVKLFLTTIAETYQMIFFFPKFLLRIISANLTENVEDLIANANNTKKIMA